MHELKSTSHCVCGSLRIDGSVGCSACSGIDPLRPSSDKHLISPYSITT